MNTLIIIGLAVFLASLIIFLIPRLFGNLFSEFERKISSKTEDFILRGNDAILQFSKFSGGTIKKSQSVSSGYNTVTGNGKVSMASTINIEYKPKKKRSKERAYQVSLQFGHKASITISVLNATVNAIIRASIPSDSTDIANTPIGSSKDFLNKTISTVTNTVIPAIGLENETFIFRFKLPANNDEAFTISLIAIMTIDVGTAAGNQGTAKGNAAIEVTNIKEERLKTI